MTDIFWRRRATFSTLQEVAYLERTAAHVLAGWLPKVTPIAAKLMLGRFQYRSMQHASILTRLIGALSQPWGGWREELAAGWRDYAAAIDRSGTEAGFLEALFGHLKHRARDLAQDVKSHVDPVLDLHVCEELDSMLRDTQEQLEWYRAQPIPVLDASRLEVLDRLWAARHVGEKMKGADLLWAPIDRVPSPTRPSHFTFRKRGAISSHAFRATDPDHIRESFHGSFDDELTTMELFARCSYEHPSLPEDFHRDMARQISDESRHAQAFLDVLKDYDASYGDYPISTGVYDFHYQFDGCERGSSRELLWRLLLRSTMQEALSLDGFVLQIKKRDYHAQGRLARVLECLMADEIFHVRSGVRWSTMLCGNDRARMRDELEQAHTYYVEELSALRRKFVAENPDEALEELEFVRQRDTEVTEEYPFDLAIGTNRVARIAAGLTDEEIEMVVRWGYASQ